MRKPESFNICPRCRKELIGTMKFCTECGSKLPTPDVRPNQREALIGEIIAAECEVLHSEMREVGVNFCGACGQDLRN